MRMCTSGLPMDRRGAWCISRGRGTWASDLKEGIELSHLPYAEESTVTDLAVAKIDSLVVEQIRAMSLTAGKLSYSPSAKDAIQRVYSEGAAGAVLVGPTTVEQVLAVSDAGGFMPQKSTYFDPKVPSGLVVLGW